MASIIKCDTIQSTTSNVFFQNSVGTEYARFDSTGVFQLANPSSFAAGTAAAPSITATGDTNTGIFFPAADTIGFSEGGAEIARFDSSGNFGLGVTPTSYATVKAIQLNTASTLMAFTNEFDIGQNVYYNAGNKYITTGAATLYAQTTGQHQWFNAASGTAGNAITFTQAMTLDASGNLIVNGTSASSIATIYPASGSSNTLAYRTSGNTGAGVLHAYSDVNGPAGGIGHNISINSAGSSSRFNATYAAWSIWLDCRTGNEALRFDYLNTSGTYSERGRIDSSGNFLVGTTTANPAVLNAAGAMLAPTRNEFSVDGSVVGIFNRKTDDGEIIQFRQAGTTEGTISVSGTTVSYNGGHLSRWAQTTTAKDDSLVKGTVLSNLDAMNVYTDADGNPVDNEQLNKVKVSDVEGDANVAGVFVNWSHDEDHNVDEINMAMTGDMIIRIAQGVTVARGDLLMSAGDGTAKPQGDDIVRSKTVAKVTSTHVTCTYADGSYCVPCVLMAC